MTKSERQKKILKIISENVVSTQEELVKLLSEGGKKITQATTSRDLQEMRITKTMLPDRTYKYTAPKQEGEIISEKLSTMLSQCITSVDYALNIVVIKTLAGTAQGAAAAIDTLHLEDVIGTLAGDDTLILITKDEKCGENLTNKFKGYIF